MDKKYKPLFQPYKIGKLEIKNRYVMEPMGTVPFDPAGYYNTDACDYYGLRAKGGVGLIISGGHYGDITLDPHDVYPMPTPTQNPIMFVKFEKDMVERIHTFGAKLFIDLQFTMPFSRAEDYSTEELEFLFEQYADSALVAKNAGYDGVEILNGYINPNIQRTDKYGGDLLNRVQIDIEIMKAIKRKCGDDFPVIDRFSVSTFMKSPTTYPIPEEDYEEYGWDINKTIEAAKALEEAGFDGLHGIMGDSMSYAWSHPSMYFERGYQFKYYKQLKAAVNIPVICGGRLDDPDFALRALEEGCCDFVGLGKGLLAEPELVNKVKTNKLDDIRPCLACHEGCLGRYVNEGTFGTCAVNPLCGREHSMPVLPAVEKKKVVVVGGGPAGLEAAYIAATRGHDVTLFEATDRLGGALLVGGVPTFKGQELKLAKWFERQLNKLKVDIRMNTRATKETVQALNPDAIVDAEGAKSIVIKIPGIDDPKVCLAEDVLTGKVPQADKCIVVGGGLVGTELALMLAKNGKEVVIVEALPDILSAGKALPMYNETPLRDNLAFYGVKICTNTKLAEITDAGAVVETPEGVQTIETSQVILAIGRKPMHTIADEFEYEDVETYVAGDGVKMRNIYSAIFDGFEIGRTI